MFRNQLPTVSVPPEGKGDSGKRETMWKYTLSY